MLNEVLNISLKIFTDHNSRFVEKNNLFVKTIGTSRNEGIFRFYHKVKLLIFGCQLKKNVILNIELLVEDE